MARALGAALPNTPEVVDSLNALVPREGPEPGKTLVLNESVMTHMLADLDQIVTEMEIDFRQRSIFEWVSTLRHAVDGRDYKV